ncbi:MAG: regulatory protein RecX [Clostridia bacterium]|nr:regulatory protein RecX [Clostridia bacterium]
MDVITSIVRERSKYRVTVSEDTVIVVSGALFRERPLQEGQPIDLDEYDNWLMVRQYRQALDRAVAALASRAHSRHELENKLLRAGYRPSTVEMTLYKLETEGFLDDADFARQWVEARTSRRMGTRRIAQELRHKGVSAEEAEAALSQVNEEEQLSGAIALVEKAAARIKPDEDPRKAAQRITGMLARRGYDWDVVREALAHVMKNLD